LRFGHPKIARGPRFTGIASAEPETNAPRAETRLFWA
jgi:hypothetical protein